MKLFEIAHSRAGDKGEVLNISLIAYHPDNWNRLQSQVSANRIAEHLAFPKSVETERFELPQLCALNFVFRGALKGGVTRSLALDPHGKSYSSAILDIEIM